MSIGKNVSGQVLDIEFFNQKESWQRKNIVFDKSMYDSIAKIDRDEFEFNLHFVYLEKGIITKMKSQKLHKIHFAN